MAKYTTPNRADVGSSPTSPAKKESRDNMVEFTIQGKPRGKDRPRFSRRGNFISTYNTAGTIEYEKIVKYHYLGVSIPCPEYIGKVSVYINAYFKPPKSTSKKKFKELIGTPYLKKPDCDNIAKIICDALNGLAYKDDSQINELQVQKIYAEEERVEVKIVYG